MIKYIKNLIFANVCNCFKYHIQEEVKKKDLILKKGTIF